MARLLDVRPLLPAALVVALGACSSTTQVVGDQCPSPYSGDATVRGPHARDAQFFGTSCAPCDGSDSIKLDKRGCPIFETFESCGGPVCLGGARISPPPEGDGGSDDGGSEKDSGAEEDSGAQ